MFNVEELKVRYIFTEPLLGTVSKKEIFAEQVLSEAGVDVEDELETLPEEGERGWTGFHKDEEGLLIYNYVIKGHIKSALAFLQENGVIPKIPAYKNRVDKFIFVEPRRIHIHGEDGEIKTEPDGVLERPLRAMTRQGPRVSIARSDYVNPGSWIEFTISIYKNKNITPEIIRMCFDYGRLHGLGQWASGGYGRFKWEEVVM